MNTKTIIAMVVAVLLGGILPGCVGDMVKVNTPKALVEEEGFEPVLSYNESLEAYDDWASEQASRAESWGNRIEVGGQEVEYWRNAISFASAPENLALFGFNPGTAATSALLMGLGLFTRRPGDVPRSTMAKEKEESYNAGLDKGRSLSDG